MLSNLLTRQQLAQQGAELRDNTVDLEHDACCAVSTHLAVHQLADQLQLISHFSTGGAPGTGQPQQQSQLGFNHLNTHSTTFVQPDSTA